MNDKINPSHYKNGIETIEFLKSKFTVEEYEGFLIGNIIKYLTRYKYKDGVDDLKKAQSYLEMLIEQEE